MSMRSLLLLLPQEALIAMVVGAGLAMIVGARRLAGALLGAATLLVILPVVLAPLFDLLPGWVLACLLVFFVLGLLRTLLQLLIGRSSANHTVGILVADVLRATLLAPFCLLGWLVRAVLGRR